MADELQCLQMVCRVHYLGQEKIVNSDYRLYGQSIEVVAGKKYRRVKVTEDLPLPNHIAEVASKRNRTI